MKNQILKSDKFKKARGGYSRLLELSCNKCKARLCFYQKDGKGQLVRLYLDRMLKAEHYSRYRESPLKQIPQLVCLACKEHLGAPMIYEKEQRLAYRLFACAVIKKLVSAQDYAAVR